MTDSQQDVQKQESGATAPDGDAPKKVNVALRVYGVLMMLMGILDMVVFLFIGALLGLALYFSTMSPELAGMFNARRAEASETRPRSRWRSWRCPCASTPRSSQTRPRLRRRPRQQPSNRGARAKGPVGIDSRRAPLIWSDRSPASS